MKVADAINHTTRSTSMTQYMLSVHTV